MKDSLKGIVITLIIVAGIVVLFGQFSSCEIERSANRTEVKLKMVEKGANPMDLTCLEAPNSTACEIYIAKGEGIK